MSNIRLNAFALYGNFIVLALIGLAINPLLIRSLGVEHFGIWKACQRIIDLSSVVDGRATQALKWIIAHREGEQDIPQKRRDVGAAVVIWCIWLPFLVVAVSTSIFALPSIISGISASDLPMVRVAAGLLAANVVLTALLGIPDAVLVGSNQGYRSYVLTTLFLVLSNLGMVAVAYKGFGLVGLGVVTLVGQILNGISVYYVASRYVAWWAIRKPLWADIRKVLGFSNLVLVWSLVQAIMLSSEVLLIGYFRGSADVSIFFCTAYVSQFALSICLMTGSAVTPQLGSLVGAGNHIGAALLYCEAREVLVSILTVVASGIILLNRSFVTLWVGYDLFLGDMANLAIVGVLVQLAIIRFDAQVQDVGLNIQKKVLLGATGTALSACMGALFYAISESVAAMLVGLIIGRLPISLMFPRYAKAVISGTPNTTRCLVWMIFILFGSFIFSCAWRPDGWAELLISAIMLPGFVAMLTSVTILSKSNRHRLFMECKAILRVSR